MKLVCPHCSVTVVPQHVAGPSGDGEDRLHGVVTCPACGKWTYVITSRLPLEEIKDYYPKLVPQVDKAIPQPVAEDYIEAVKCFDTSAFKACVAMCRRALQSAVYDKGASEGRLIDQIDELASSGQLTLDLRDWAHEIRLEGNVGAHPDKDGLADVTQQDAREMLNFAEQFFNYLYVMPARVAERRTKRQG